MHADITRLNELSGVVISWAFTVLNTLGTGFLQKVYGNAMAHEMRGARLEVARQHGLAVTYDGIIVGQDAVDRLVEQTLLVELKVGKALDEVHRAQCVNYLKATGLGLCLLLSIGKSHLEIKRVADGL